MAYETIKLEMREAVALITLNRPAALNALTVEVGDEFSRAVSEARERAARAIVLTGAGRAFSAGGDLREMRSMAETEGRADAFFDEPLRLLHDCIRLIRQTPLPFIAAVNGVASGGGCNLALALVQRWLRHRKPVRRLEVRYPVQTSDRAIADARSHPKAPLPAPISPTYNEGAADRCRLDGQPRGPALARSHLMRSLEWG